MKVTPQMASKWVKAVFLIILGIVILIFADAFVDDLSALVEDVMGDTTEIAYPAIWDLLTILLWILVAWLFVDAALTIALSFSEHRYSLLDVMKRLQRIEKKLGVAEPSAPSEKVEFESEMAMKAVEESPEEDVPPPPRE
jgi:hypothetical protein